MLTIVTYSTVFVQLVKPWIDLLKISSPLASLQSNGRKVKHSSSLTGFRKTITSTGDGRSDSKTKLYLKYTAVASEE